MKGRGVVRFVASVFAGSLVAAGGTVASYRLVPDGSSQCSGAGSIYRPDTRTTRKVRRSREAAFQMLSGEAWAEL